MEPSQVPMNTWCQVPSLRCSAVPADMTSVAGAAHWTGKTLSYALPPASAFDNRPLQFHEFEEFMKHVIYNSATPGPFERKISGQIVEQLLRPTGLLDPDITVRKVEGQIDHLMGDQKESRYGYYYDSSVKRSLYMDDVLYTFSDKYLKMNQLDDLEEINNIELKKERKTSDDDFDVVN